MTTPQTPASSSPSTPAQADPSAAMPAGTESLTPAPDSSGITGASLGSPSASMPPLQDPPGLGASLVSTTLALCFVLALAYGVLWTIKRLQSRGGKAGKPGAAERPQVMQAVALGRTERLVTVRYRGREYLLGVADRSINVIDSFRLQPPAPVADEPDDALRG